MPKVSQYITVYRTLAPSIVIRIKSPDSSQYTLLGPHEYHQRYVDPSLRTMGFVPFWKVQSGHIRIQWVQIVQINVCRSQMLVPLCGAWTKQRQWDVREEKHWTVFFFPPRRQRETQTTTTSFLQTFTYIHTQHVLFYRLTPRGTGVWRR